MAFHYNNPIPPGPLVPDGMWHPAFGPPPGHPGPPMFTNSHGNFMDFNMKPPFIPQQERSNPEIDLDQGIARDKEQRQRRSGERVDNDRSRYDKQTPVRSRSPDRHRRVLGDVDLRHRTPNDAELNSQPGILFNNLPIGEMYGPPMMNSQLTMMSGMNPGPASKPSAELGEIKEIIALKTCTLLPPHPDTTVPALRPKPPGCRTIFVGGLFDNIRECLLEEIFERFGEISTIRISKKNFCHVRFEDPLSVEGAVSISGYRLRADEKDPHGDIKTNSCWLHVDYALARNDQADYEHQQHKIRDKHEHEKGEMRREPSPLLVDRYTVVEADTLSNMLKADDTFMTAIQTLSIWLERGECCKKNANVFYKLIQNTNAQVRRLLMEKSVQEEKLQAAKDAIRDKMHEILQQFLQVEKVYHAASHKKVWDHFSKAQRRNIDMWKKQASEIRSLQLEEFLAETEDAVRGGGDEMDFSDEEDASVPKITSGADELKEENDTLRSQLDIYFNELAMARQESESLKYQLSQLQQQKGIQPKAENEYKPSLKPLDDKKAKLIGIIATFLHIHPFGASTDYILSYVQKLLPTMKSSEVEDILRAFPTVFIQKITGVGANIERRWIFTGFNMHTSI